MFWKQFKKYYKDSIKHITIKYTLLNKNNNVLLLYFYKQCYFNAGQSIFIREQNYFYK